MRTAGYGGPTVGACLIATIASLSARPMVYCRPRGRVPDAPRHNARRLFALLSPPCAKTIVWLDKTMDKTHGVALRNIPLSSPSFPLLSLHPRCAVRRASSSTSIRLPRPAWPTHLLCTSLNPRLPSPHRQSPRLLLRNAHLPRHLSHFCSHFSPVASSSSSSSRPFSLRSLREASRHS